MEYEYKKDGKFETRYSELTMCGSPARAIRVAETRLGLRGRFTNHQMDFGSDRHQMFVEETVKTEMTPAVFQWELGFSMVVNHAEEHFITELFKDVHLHFTPDAVGKYDIVDYKTTTSSGGLYQDSIQVDLYALGLLAHGIRIQRAHYLVEQWSPDRDDILGYFHFQHEVGIKELAAAKRWAKKRVELLWSAMDHVRKEHGLTAATEV